MEMAAIILKQTLTMALYMAAGWALFKTGKITQDGSRVLGTLLLHLIVPCVLVKSFCVEFSMEKLMMFVQSFLLCSVALFLSTTTAKLLFKKHPLDCFSVAFSNAGFIGIPLVTAALGEEAVFYLSGMLIWVNLLQWNWGVSVIAGQKTRFSFRILLRNPFIVATIIGLFLFVTGLGTRLPDIVSGALAGTAAVNTPIAMIVLGVYLAQTKISSLFTTPRLYLISAVRLWLMPLITLAVFALIPFANDIRMAVLISSSTAVGANIAVYAQMYHSDYSYACKTVALSTIVSIVMMPVFIMLATKVFGM